VNTDLQEPLEVTNFVSQANSEQPLQVKQMM